MEYRQLADFQATVWAYYNQHGRDLPWRQTGDGLFDPYKILVSEIMLQQTQAARVIPKYETFLRQFPSPQALAQASLGEVLRLWSGLGYNRRAKFLWQAAQQLVAMDAIPTSVQEWQKLPGVGANTAGAIVAYAFNQPVVFIETNIRTVFIHHFFTDQLKVTDAELMPLIKAALPADGKVREWYWALMDYGTYLKATTGNAARRSQHYTKQSAFAGSLRQLRGAILRQLSSRAYTLAELQVALPDSRLETALTSLAKDGLVATDGAKWYLPK